MLFQLWIGHYFREKNCTQIVACQTHSYGNYNSQQNEPENKLDFINVSVTYLESLENKGHHLNYVTWNMFSCFRSICLISFIQLQPNLDFQCICDKQSRYWIAAAHFSPNAHNAVSTKEIMSSTTTRPSVLNWSERYKIHLDRQERSE